MVWFAWKFRMKLVLPFTSNVVLWFHQSVVSLFIFTGENKPNFFKMRKLRIEAFNWLKINWNVSNVIILFCRHDLWSFQPLKISPWCAAYENFTRNLEDFKVLLFIIAWFKIECINFNLITSSVKITPTKKILFLLCYLFHYRFFMFSNPRRIFIMNALNNAISKKPLTLEFRINYTANKLYCNSRI